MEMVLCLYQTRVVYSLCEFEREREFLSVFISFSAISFVRAVLAVP